MGLVGASAAATAYVLWPLLPELLLAAVLASASSPAHGWLTKRIGNRPMAAAIFLAVASVILIFVPLATAIGSAAGDAGRAAQALRARIDAEGIQGMLVHVPEAIRVRIATIDLDRAIVSDLLGTLSGRAIAWARAALKTTSDAVLSAAWVLIAFVVFLVDGRRAVQWIDGVVPLERGQVLELLDEFRRVGISVLIGNFGTSAIQACVAFVGYRLAEVPSPLLLSLMTFVLSFVPMVGGAGSTLAVAAVLGIAGASSRALFLAVWAIMVVGVVDNLVKPLLVKRGIKLHGALVFLAIVAGLVSLGPSGVLLGPMLISFTLALVRIQERAGPGARTASDLGPPHRARDGSGGVGHSGGDHAPSRPQTAKPHSDDGR